MFGHLPNEHWEIHCQETVKAVKDHSLSSIPHGGRHSDRQPDKAVKDRELRHSEYKPGDLVIYTVTKQSPHPGPRARGIQPSEGGEDYAYVVDKFWMVLEVLSGDQLLLATRRGKRRTVLVTDPMLRKRFQSLCGVFSVSNSRPGKRFR